MLLAFFAVQLDAHHVFTPRTTQGSVLAYASEMSLGGLLSSTNAARAANGLGSLRNSSQLNNSAQMKAQDMANKDYWAHVAPDGTQPWYFFQAAGYGYSRAGENLAFGFMTSQSTVDGWMNSASHRANILGDFVDVGFGVVNTPNYQGSGMQTIVVAHYGTPLNYAPPAPAPAPAPTPAPSPAPAPPTASAAVAKNSSPTAPTSPTGAPNTPDNEEKPSAEQPTNSPSTQQAGTANNKQGEANDAKATVAPVQTGTTRSISLLDLFRQKRAPVLALAALSLSTLGLLGYAMTHRRAFQQALVSGEQFAMKHPAIDAVIIISIVALMLLTSYGRIG